MASQKTSEIKSKKDAAAAKMATTIEQYAAALADADRAVACSRMSPEQVCPEKLRWYIKEVKITGLKANDAIRAAGMRTTKKEQGPSLPPSVYWRISQICRPRDPVDHFCCVDDSRFPYVLEDRIRAHDDWLLQHIRGSTKLSLTISDLHAIYRRFGLYEEIFSPGADGRVYNRKIVDAETWRTYSDLQFPQFPLHFVEDKKDAAESTTFAAGTLAAEVERAAADKEAAKLARQTASVKCAEDAAAADAAVGAKAWADADDEDITDHDFLIQYMRDTEYEHPLHLSRQNLQAIHSQFESYTECFPPGANGRHQFLVDTKTWRTYCELQLQFSQFPLHFVDDERKLLPPEA
jgi:hypothetical protein